MLHLELQHGVLYVDNVKFCYYEVSANDGRKDLPKGTYVAEARYAHSFGKVLPHIESIGWAGADAGCQIILGRVRAKSGLIPDGYIVQVLISAIEAASDLGDQVLAEVR